MTGAGFLVHTERHRPCQRVKLRYALDTDPADEPRKLHDGHEAAGAEL